MPDNSTIVPFRVRTANALPFSNSKSTNVLKHCLQLLEDSAVNPSTISVKTDRAVSTFRRNKLAETVFKEAKSSSPNSFQNIVLNHHSQKKEFLTFIAKKLEGPSGLTALNSFNFYNVTETNGTTYNALGREIFKSKITFTDRSNTDRTHFIEHVLLIEIDNVNRFVNYKSDREKKIELRDLLKAKISSETCSFVTLFDYDLYQELNVDKSDDVSSSSESGFDLNQEDEVLLDERLKNIIDIKCRGRSAIKNGLVTAVVDYENFPMFKDLLGDLQGTSFNVSTTDKKGDRGRKLALMNYSESLEEIISNIEYNYRQTLSCLHGKDKHHNEKVIHNRVYNKFQNSVKCECSYKFWAYMSRHNPTKVIIQFSQYHDSSLHPIRQKLPLSKQVRSYVRHLVIQNSDVSVPYIRNNCLNKFGHYLESNEFYDVQDRPNVAHKYIPNYETIKTIKRDVLKDFEDEVSEDILNLINEHPDDFQPRLLKRLEMLKYVSNDGSRLEGWYKYNNDGKMGKMKIKVQLKTATSDFYILIIPEIEVFLRKKFLSHTRQMLIDATHGTNRHNFQAFQIRTPTNIKKNVLATFITQKASTNHLKKILDSWKEFVGLESSEVKFIISDMALEESRAVVETCFENADVKYCAFHVAQAICRQFKKKKGTDAAMEDLNSELLGLALDAIRDPTIESLEELKRRVSTVNLSENVFADYLSNYYLSANCRYPETTWARYHFVDIDYVAFVTGTNNGVEGNWSALKNIWPEMASGKNTMENCVEIFLKQMKFETVSFYDENIKLLMRDSETLHPDLEFQRPQFYTKFTSPHNKRIKKARSENEPGWIIRELDTNGIPGENLRSFSIRVGLDVQEEIVTFSLTKIKCTGYSCSEFYSNGVPCIHMIAGIIFESFSFSDLPEFYQNLTIHRVCDEFIEIHKQPGKRPIDWIAQIIRLVDPNTEYNPPEHNYSLDSGPTGTRTPPSPRVVHTIDRSNQIVNSIRQANLKNIAEVKNDIHYFELTQAYKTDAEVAKVSILLQGVKMAISNILNSERTNETVTSIDVTYTRDNQGRQVYNFGNILPINSRNVVETYSIKMDCGQPYAFMKEGSNEFFIGDLVRISGFRTQQDVTFKINYYNKKNASGLNWVQNSRENEIVVHFSQIIPLTVEYSYYHRNNKLHYDIKNFDELKQLFIKFKHGEVESHQASNLEYASPGDADENGWRIPLSSDDLRLYRSFQENHVQNNQENIQYTWSNDQRRDWNLKTSRAGARNRQNLVKNLIDTNELKKFVKSGPFSSGIDSWLDCSTADYCIQQMLSLLKDDTSVACFDLFFSRYFNVEGRNSVRNFNRPVNHTGSPAQRHRAIERSDRISDSIFIERDILKHYVNSYQLLNNEIDELKEFDPKLNRNGFFSRKRCIDFRSLEILIVPVFYGVHFALMFIDMRNKSLTYIDRLNNVETVRTEQNKDKFEHLYTYSFPRALDKCYTENNDGVTPIYNFSKFKVNMFGKNNIPRNERQSDGSSCGIIMLTQIYMLITKKKLTTLKNENRKEAREQLGAFMFKAFKNAYGF